VENAVAKSFGAAGWGCAAPRFVPALGLWVRELSLEPRGLGPSAARDGDGAASAWPAVGTRGGGWPEAGSPGAAVVVVEGFGELGGGAGSWLSPAAARSDSPWLPVSVTWGGDVLLCVITTSGLRCQLLLPELLGHL